mgnify:CR=1 FL=1
MGDSTDIDSLIKEMNGADLSQEENSMVNSILNDLNDTGGQEQGKQVPQMTSQQQMPQITDEEKAMLIQQQMQQQRIAQQRMQQQMAQQQQIAQQQQMVQQQQQVKEAPQSPVEKIKSLLFENKDVIIVLFLSILFNLEVISENLKIKNVSLLYNEAEGKETVLSTVMKGVIIAVIFLILKLFIK